MFLGFLPRKDSERRKLFENNLKNDATLVFFESPKRLIKTLLVMRDVYPQNKQIVICREMTKIYEEVIRGTISNTLQKVSSRVIKGEICLLIEGYKSSLGTKLSLNREIKDLVLKNMSPNDAAKLLSLITKHNKRELYNLLIKKS